MSRRFDPLGGAEREHPAGGEPPAGIGELTGAMATELGWRERLRGARVHDCWLDIAGEELARHVQPVRLHGGVLVVRASSGVWATQVRYLARELTDRANAVLGPGQVRQVTVVSHRNAR